MCFLSPKIRVCFSVFIFEKYVEVSDCYLLFFLFFFIFSFLLLLFPFPMTLIYPLFIFLVFSLLYYFSADLSFVLKLSAVAWMLVRCFPFYRKSKGNKITERRKLSSMVKMQEEEVIGLSNYREWVCELQTCLRGLYRWSYLPLPLCEKSLPVLEPNSCHFHKYNKIGTDCRLKLDSLRKHCYFSPLTSFSLITKLNELRKSVIVLLVG